jgi:hypothetical protein
MIVKIAIGVLKLFVRNRHARCKRVNLQNTVRLCHNQIMAVGERRPELYSSVGKIGAFWRCVEFLANAFGRILPTIPFVERQVAHEYICLVEQHDEIKNSIDTRNSVFDCPSYPVASSDRIIAKRRRGSRSFSFLNETVSVVSGVRDSRQLDIDLSYVRTSGRCITNSCAHWTGSTCRLGAAISSVQLRAKPPKSCPIRESCRWNFENPESACRSCKFLPYSKLLNLIPN